MEREHLEGQFHLSYASVDSLTYWTCELGEVCRHAAKQPWSPHAHIQRYPN